MTGTGPARGRLFLVPAPLDFGCDVVTDLRQTLPDASLRAAASLSHWVCENAKTARAYLKRIDAVHALCVPIQAMHIIQLPREVHKKGDHDGNFDARHLMAPALQGHDMGLLSEAGMPAIADPGSSVVRAAHDLDIAVVPLVGPLSLMLALAASGMNGQDFAFVGYIPSGPAERVARIRALEALALGRGQTQLLIETPYRNPALLASLLQTLGPETRLATASGLGMPGEICRSASVKTWRAKAWECDKSTPTVFAIGR
jgi:16S rRNA (cytidine1402-2'-O)-methyltransferase